MPDEQEPFDKIDISFMLKTIMAGNNLSVADVAKVAGVSKSTIEKYLAGPSSPRAVALASLSRALNIPVDTIIFGEMDRPTEAAFQLALRAFVRLIKDLKDDPELNEKFSNLGADTKEFEDFAWNIAYVRSAAFKQELRDHEFGSRSGTKVVVL